MIESKNHTEFVKLFQNKFDLEDYKGAELLAKNYNYKSVREENFEDLLEFFIRYINEKTEKQKNFNPETVLLEIVQKIPELNDDLTFLSLLTILQEVLLKIPPKRDSYLIWGLNSVQKYVEKIEIPEYDLIHEEKLLIDSDPLVDQCTSLFLDLLPFYDSLVTNLTDKKWRQILSIYLLKLLGNPLAHLDLTAENSKSRARRVAESIIEMYLKVQNNIYLLLEFKNNLKNEELQCDELGVSVLFYLVLVEHVSIKSIPQVYSHFFIFQNCLSLVIKLLSESHQLTIKYGLDLFHTLLNKVRDICLPYDLLDCSIHSQLCRKLSTIIIYNNIESYRKQALQLFTKYLHQFETRGQYLLISNLINVVNHTGLISYLITEYKQLLVTELNSKGDGQEVSLYFSGAKLNKLLHKFCFLHKKEESDLVELADQIIAALNFLRFLLIRDKNNTTKIWDFIPSLEDYYLEPLKRGLELSRAHYELKIKEVNEEKEDDMISDKISVSIGKQTLPSMPKTEKLKVLNSSLTAFDVIESILSRVRELINAH